MIEDIDSWDEYEDPFRLEMLESVDTDRFEVVARPLELVRDDTKPEFRLLTLGPGDGNAELRVVLLNESSSELKLVELV